MNWKTALVVFAAFLTGFGVLVRIATRVPAPPDHQVFINGDILTMDSDNRIVEAIAVRRDRIEAVGTTDEIMALTNDNTEVVDLRGRTILPGFIDAHGHFPGSGMRVIAAASVPGIHTKYKPALRALYGPVDVVEMYIATEGTFAQQLLDAVTAAA